MIVLQKHIKDIEITVESDLVKIRRSYFQNENKRDCL